MGKKRKIAIFTGNRAEYGLQYPIIRAIVAHPHLEYYLLVSGAHLQQDFGFTKKEIEKDGFEVFAEIKMDMKQDTLFSTVQAIGSGILSLSRTLENLRPDFHVVYADRFEGFAAVITSTQMGIPTAHIEGGDITEGGTLDDMVRHAMTKLSHLHFATNEQAVERLLKLGEEPWRVFNVGFPAIDLIADGLYASPDNVIKDYGLDAAKPVILFTQHSVTTEFELAVEQVKPSLDALRMLSMDDCQVIITYPNNDAGGRRIIAEIDAFMEAKPKNIQAHRSLGRYNYHGLVNLCGKVARGVCVGNSSSGIKETPIFGCPCVNIGTRQQGRLRAENVIDTGYDTYEIIRACNTSINDDTFRKKCSSCRNPYGIGGSGKKIAAVLAEIDIDNRLLQKKMTY
ncbi:MAG: UDP-N-acetylglucosamine 2-epimerase [bacterium]